MKSTAVSPSTSNAGTTGVRDSLGSPGEHQPSATCSSITLVSHPTLHEKRRTNRRVGFLLDRQHEDLEVTSGSMESSHRFTIPGHTLRETKSHLWRSHELETLRELTLRCGENFARVASELGYEVVPQAPVATSKSEQQDSMGACASGQGCPAYENTVMEGVEEGSLWDRSFLITGLCGLTGNPLGSRENVGASFFPHFSPLEHHFKPVERFGNLCQSMLPTDAEFRRNNGEEGKNFSTAQVELLPPNCLFRVAKNESTSDCSVSISDEMATVPFITLPLDEMVMPLEECSSLESQNFSSVSTFHASQGGLTPGEITARDTSPSLQFGNSLSTACTARQANLSANEYSHNRNELRFELDPSSAVNPTTLFEHLDESGDGHDGLNVFSRDWSPNRDPSRNQAPATVLPNAHPGHFLPDEHQASLSLHNVSFSHDGDGELATRLNQNYPITPLTPTLNELHASSSAARPHIF